jgi:hypothetical protein
LNSSVLLYLLLLKKGFNQRKVYPGCLLHWSWVPPFSSP